MADANRVAIRTAKALEASQLGQADTNAKLDELLKQVELLSRKVDMLLKPEGARPATPRPAAAKPAAAKPAGKSG